MLVRLLARLFIAVVVVFFAGALLVVASGALDTARFKPACPPGIGHGLWDLDFLSQEDAARGAAAKLLDNPNFGASPAAARDLEAGIVDERLVAVLRAVAEKHRICVDAFKEGHYFLPGVEDGPRIPEGYGEAGGLPNTHYYGRAADIRWVDGKPVRGNASHPDVQDVGRILADIPASRRPDQIIGPPGWHRALGYPREAGWLPDADQLELHEDHLHIGYVEQKGTRNSR